METTYGQRIRQVRQRLGISQRELADRVHVTKQNITQIERGYRQPKAERLVALATALGVSSDYILGLQETM